MLILILQFLDREKQKLMMRPGTGFTCTSSQPADSVFFQVNLEDSCQIAFRITNILNKSTDPKSYVFCASIGNKGLFFPVQEQKTFSAVD